MKAIASVGPALLRFTGSTEAAEDVVQESFVRLCRDWERAAQPGAYLRTVVR